MEHGALHNALALGAEELAVVLSTLQQQQLITYIEHLARWNKAMNLTAVREPLAMVNKHLLDSIAMLPYLNGERIVDVGSGPGLPGIPLAIICPERQFCLVESRTKRCQFMRQIAHELGISNVEVVEKRAEAFTAEPGFDTIISRAFAELALFIKVTQHLLAEHGQWLAMKGALHQEELAAIPPGFQIVAAQPVQIPGVTAERHVVLIQRD